MMLTHFVSLRCRVLEGSRRRALASCRRPNQYLLEFVVRMRLRLSCFIQMFRTRRRITGLSRSRHTTAPPMDTCYGGTKSLLNFSSTHILPLATVPTCPTRVVCAHSSPCTTRLVRSFQCCRLFSLFSALDPSLCQEQSSTCGR